MNDRVKSVWKGPVTRSTPGLGYSQESLEVWYGKHVRVTTIFTPSGPSIRYFPDLVFSSASYGV